MASAGSRGTLLGLLLLFVLLGAGGRALWLWLDRPIERVSISGDLDYVSASYLREELAPLVQGQSWLSVDLQKLRDRARAIEWLSEVRVSRHWPDALMFELYEQNPVARWNDALLLNSRGIPFRRGEVTVPDDLPDLAGPPGSGPEVLALLDRLQGGLASLNLKVTQLRLEDRGAWRFEIDDGVWVMLGRNQRDSRLARFAAAWQRQLVSQASRIRYIDLRYPNGIVVAWHGETEVAVPQR
ncbi:cell division protein FtsQ [Modicisalibacter ilicicola DSM 19980]|uniref:Cell division protein FtsQ n=1 Tax=Modicisalibacter ilicicola DSM 19980 TaxID=1121942 RepID=A0A1M5C5R7_9GAMM|nr:cell division protein FtsQ/DivIB [Halomonas ilicicola]SHF49986.1 cell division protein FtsQ [Halomonas ilicicola DSM 19980]